MLLSDDIIIKVGVRIEDDMLELYSHNTRLKVLENCLEGTYVAVHYLCSHSSDQRLQAQFEFSACELYLTRAKI